MIFDKLDLRHRKVVWQITRTRVQVSVAINDMIKGAEKEAEGAVIDYENRGLHEIFNMSIEPDMKVYEFLMKYFTMVTVLTVFSRTSKKKYLEQVERGIWDGISKGYEKVLSYEDQQLIAEEVFYADKKKPEFPKTVGIFSVVFYGDGLKEISEEDYFDQLEPTMEHVLKSIYEELNDYLNGVEIVPNAGGDVVVIDGQKIKTKLK